MNEKGMRVAIVGSRNFRNLRLIWDYVMDLPSGTIVVSGGAKGVDTAAESAARAYSYEVLIFHPDWDKYGKKAGFLRNQIIVDNCDRVVAFWDQQSRGTGHTIELAKRAKKPVVIHDAWGQVFTPKEGK